MIPKSRLLIFLLIPLALLFSCSKKEKTVSGPDPIVINPVDLIVSPSTGIPGSITNISGFVADSSNAESYSVSVGGESALFQIEDDGSLTLFIPLFLDSNDWSSPPVSAQTVEIKRDSTIVGRASNALTILPLPKAPGSTLKAVVALEEIAGSLEALFNAIPVQDSIEAPVRAAMIASLKGLINGGDSSLMAVIQGHSAYLDSSTYNLELLDAMMASTGLLSAYEDLSDKMSILNNSSLTAMKDENGISICVGYNQDQLLACGLQIHVLLQDWTNQVLGETIST